MKDHEGLKDLPCGRNPSGRNGAGSCDLGDGLKKKRSCHAPVMQTLTKHTNSYKHVKSCHPPKLDYTYRLQTFWNPPRPRSESSTSSSASDVVLVLGSMDRGRFATESGPRGSQRRSLEGTT